MMMVFKDIGLPVKFRDETDMAAILDLQGLSKTD